VVVGLSTDFALEAEDEATVIHRSTCRNVTLNGTLGVNVATWTITPGLNCPPDTTNGTWTAMDENLTQAALKIPATIKVELGIVGACKLVFATQTITKAANYANGLNGGRNPSQWHIDDNVAYLSQNPANAAAIKVS
jgi:hypothetical protein